MSNVEVKKDSVVIDNDVDLGELFRKIVRILEGILYVVFWVINELNSLTIIFIDRMELLVFHSKFVWWRVDGKFRWKVLDKRVKYCEYIYGVELIQHTMSRYNYYYFLLDSIPPSGVLDINFRNILINVTRFGNFWEISYVDYMDKLLLHDDFDTKLKIVEDLFIKNGFIHVNRSKRNRERTYCNFEHKGMRVVYGVTKSRDLAFSIIKYLGDMYHDDNFDINLNLTIYSYGNDYGNKFRSWLKTRCPDCI